MRRSLRKIILGFLFVMLGAELSWALYRGDEYKPRDYRLGAEYFMDRLCILPTIESLLAYRDANNAYLGAAGSYTSEDLFLIQNLKLQHGLFPETKFVFNFDMNQDYDGIYEHHFLEIDGPTNGIDSVGLMGEPMAQKEYADIGVMAQRKTAISQARTEFILPNFVFAGKNNDNAYYLKAPYNMRFFGWQPLVTGLEVFVTADLDFPSETDYVTPEFTFSYQSYKPAGGVIWRVADRQMIWLEGQYENTNKERDGYDAGDPKNFHTQRRVILGRLEYVYGLPNSYRSTLGVEYVNFSELNAYPNDPASANTLDHLSRIAYGTYQMPLVALLCMQVGLYVDVVNHDQDYPDNPKEVEQKDGWSGKVPVTLVWSDRSFSAQVGVSMEIDQPKFGGGYVGLTVIF